MRYDQRMRYWIASLLVCGSVFAAPELSLDWIHGNVKQTTTIEGFLSRFHPQTLEHHLLVYGSESQQLALPLSPRVLVYSPGADFIMAFNGQSDLEGYHDIEIMRFDHHDWKFHPEVIHFDPAGKQTPQIDEHPTICASCHQLDVRPNWDSYFHWVGFYGSEDDNHNAGAPNLNDIVTTGPEATFYALFQVKKKIQSTLHIGRYRFLPERNYTDRPNLDFNNAITPLNMRRFLRIIAEHPQAAQILPHLDAGIVKIDELPRELLRGAKRTYKQVYDDTKQTILDARRERVARHARLTGAPPVGRGREMANDGYWQQSLENELKFAASWRFVFEEIFHEPFRPISTARHKDYRVNLLAQVSFMNLVKRTQIRYGRVILPKDE